MATLALSLAGAGLGSITGIGAGTGWQLGSTLGRIFFPSGDDRGGPRLDTLRVTGSSYGMPIPKLFGTMRMGGNIIWAGPVEAEAAGQGDGGKGGAGRGHAAGGYRYFASFAVAFAEGELPSLLKLWADGKLILDREGAGETRIPGLRVRYYSGTDGQLPDSIMEADLGAGNVPAYRGVSYVVFDRLPLADYGNRLPNIEALLSAGGARSYPFETGANQTVNASSLAFDPYRRSLFSYEVIGGVDTVRKIDADSLSVLGEAPVSEEGFPRLPVSMDTLPLDRNGVIWIGTGLGMFGTRTIARFDTVAMRRMDTVPLPSGIGAVSHSTDVRSSVTGALFQVAGSQSGGQVVVFDQTGAVCGRVDTATRYCSGAVTDRDEVAWISMSGRYSTAWFTDLEIVAVRLDTRQAPSGPAVAMEAEHFTVPGADLTPGNAGETNNVTRLVAYLRDRAELVFQNDYRLFKWSLLSGTITAFRDDLQGLRVSPVHVNDDVSLVYLQDGRYLVSLDAETLAERSREDAGNFGVTGGQFSFFHDAVSNSAIILSRVQGLRRLYLNRQQGSKAGFKSLFERLGAMAGLSLSDLDTGQVTGSIGGYVLNRPMSLQEALKPVLSAGGYDLVECGYKLCFKPETDSLAATIPEEAFLEPVVRTRIQESELPESLTVSYMATDGGYLAGAQSARRHQTPRATMFARNETTLDLPMALGGGQAKALCQNLLREAWAEREQARGVLPLRYLYLDPSDRVAITGAGTRQECRLVQTHLGGDLSMEVEGIAFSRTERREQVDADAGAGVPAYAIHRPQMLEPFILDLPLLRDEDALAGTGSRYYFAAAGYGARWNGGGLYSSETGERFTFQDAVDRQVAWGIALNALGEPVTPYRTDWENSLTVRLLHGADQFENIPEADFLNGTNPVLVGQELVQFKSVQDNGDGTITLSTLLRGRRGTDPFAGGHQAGERVFLLDSNTVRRGQVPLSRLLMPLHWKAVAAGQLLEQAPPLIQSLTGRDLKPYAPVHLSGGRSGGTLQVSWVRRSRIAGSGLSAPVPLSEGSERYEIVFRYGAEMVSKYVRDTLSFEYQLAEFNEDFNLTLEEIPTLEVTVFQLSDAIGRGYPVKGEF